VLPLPKSWIAASTATDGLGLQLKFVEEIESDYNNIIIKQDIQGIFIKIPTTFSCQTHHFKIICDISKKKLPVR
jgi:hypothetical protein